jgi:uncharacterized protein (DUF2237 family)
MRPAKSRARPQLWLAVAGKCAHLLRDTFGSHKSNDPHGNPLTHLMASNVLGKPLQGCCTSPMTGFYRDGFCHTGPGDTGLHTVCAVMTGEFLEFSRARGNDLSTPVPEYDFPGLKPGDRWCLCVTRWVEAFNAGQAPSVVLEATHIHALEFVPLEALRAHAVR